MVPEGWVISQFGKVCKVEGGFAFKSKDFIDEVENAVPIVRMSNLKEGRLDLSDAKRVSNSLVSSLSRFKLQQGDFLFGMSGSLDNYAVVYPEDLPCFLNQRVGKLKEKGADPLFLRMVFRSKPFRDGLKNLAAGAAQLNSSPKQIESLLVPLPPLPEQKKIAAILSSVDDAIQATQAVIDQTRRVKQGLMQQLLTRGIGHINLKEKEINQFPKGWKWVNLGDVTNESKIRNDGSFSDDDLYAVTKINGIIPMRERVRGKNLDRCKVVLPTAFAYNPMRINIGSIAQWDGGKPVIVSPDYVVFECDSSKINSLYLNYIRKSHAWAQFMENAGNGSVRIRIYYKNLADFQFLLPPLQDQKQIVTILKSFDEVLKVEQEKLEQTLTIKRGLMQDLLTGRVRVKLTKEATT